MSEFNDELIRPHVLEPSLDEGYQAMAADREREAEALEWSDALIGDLLEAAE